MAELVNEGTQHGDIFCACRVRFIFGLLGYKRVIVKAVTAFRINSPCTILQTIHVVKKFTIKFARLFLGSGMQYNKRDYLFVLASPCFKIRTIDHRIY